MKTIKLKLQRISDNFFLSDWIAGNPIWVKESIRAMEVWDRPDIIFRIENYYEYPYTFKFN
jgi:hypothetical protein